MIFFKKNSIFGLDWYMQCSECVMNSPRYNTIDLKLSW